MEEEESIDNNNNDTCDNNNNNNNTNARLDGSYWHLDPSHPRTRTCPSTNRPIVMAPDELGEEEDEETDMLQNCHHRCTMAITKSDHIDRSQTCTQSTSDSYEATAT